MHFENEFMKYTLLKIDSMIDTYMNILFFNYWRD